MPMNQFVEKNLSPPRGLDCCSSSTKTLAWNINVHLPFFVMSIGAGVESGSALVPDPAWRTISCGKVSGCMVIKSVPPMSIPCICMPSIPGMPCMSSSFLPLCCAPANAGIARSNANIAIQCRIENISRGCFLCVDGVLVSSVFSVLNVLLFCRKRLSTQRTQRSQRNAERRKSGGF